MGNYYSSPTGTPWGPRQMPNSTFQRVPTPSFDGSTPWKDFLVQFELIAELNGWDERCRSLQLAASLRGPAQAVLADLEPRRRRSFHLLVDVLEQRFGSSNQTEVFKAMLRNRSRKPTESLPELAHDIKRLLSRAYPDASREMKETLAKDFFIDALGDGDVKWKVYQARARSLEEAVTVAVEFEAFTLAETKKNPTRKLAVRTVNEKTEPNPKSGTVDELTKTLTEALAKGFENLTQQLSQLQAGKNMVGHGKSKKKRTNDGKCWECGEAGHFSRDCPRKNQKQTPRVETEPKGNDQ